MVPALLALAIAAPPPFALYAMDTGTKTRYPGSDTSIEAQLDLVKSLGYAGITWTLGDPAETTKVAVEAKKRGLGLCAIYCPARLEAGRFVPDPGIAPTMDALRGHGTIIWIHITSTDVPKSSPDGDPAAVEGLRVLADSAKRNGLRIALYPHAGDWVERAGDAIRVAAKVARKEVGATLNLCHALWAGDEARIPALIKEAGKSLFCVSINGADTGAPGAGWDRLIQTLDRGTLDVLPLLKELRSARYRGPIALQGYGIGGDVRDNLTRSFRAWQGYLDRLK